MYGPGSPALGCLMAVRLIEKGVRMVQLYHGKTIRSTRTTISCSTSTPRVKVTGLMPR